MFLSKELTIRSLIESRNGIHLTGYLVNQGEDPGRIKEQLVTLRNEASDFLAPAMSAEERQKFLAPIDQLLEDGRLIERMRGNIGIFRTKEAFRVLSIPVEVEPTCIVATSFHVKPLIRWLQSDPEFLLLGLNKSESHLYFGDQRSLMKLGSFRKARGRKGSLRLLNSLGPVHDWLEGLTSENLPRLFVAGDGALTRAFFKETRYRNAVRTPIQHSFEEEHATMIAARIRALHKRDLSLKLEKAMIEFHLAEARNLSRKSIFQIAKAAIQGRVRKLIIADGIRIFGKVDPKSGWVALHPQDLDHEDDDILDDLAQTVLSQGGEVIVARQDDLPRGRPILAILNEKPGAAPASMSGDSMSKFIMKGASA